MLTLVAQQRAPEGSIINSVPSSSQTAPAAPTDGGAPAAPTDGGRGGILDKLQQPAVPTDR